MEPQTLAIQKLFLQTVRERGLSAVSFERLASAHKDMLEKRGDVRILKSDYRALFRVVLTGGVFDILHPGHLHTLQEAKKRGDILIVVVATDANVLKRKGRDPMHNAEERAELVGALNPVDLALVGEADWKSTLARVGPDVVVFGYDQKPLELPVGIEVVHLTTHGANPNSKTGAVRERFGL